MSCHLVDLTGKTFNRLTVIRRVENSKSKQTKWKCRCSCGNIVIVFASHIKDGHTKSCGCLNDELRIERKTTHGLYYTPEWGIWNQMIQRCTNPKNQAFKDYGGRGITVCDKWRNNFMTFSKDMGKRPSKNLTIERINNNKGYSPDNCKWETRKKQANNTRGNQNITIQGWTLTMTQWAQFAGKVVGTVWSRLNVLNWPPEKAIFYPVKYRKSHTETP